MFDFPSLYHLHHEKRPHKVKLQLYIQPASASSNDSYWQYFAAAVDMLLLQTDDLTLSTAMEVGILIFQPGLELECVQLKCDIIPVYEFQPTPQGLTWRSRVIGIGVEVWLMNLMRCCMFDKWSPKSNHHWVQQDFFCPYSSASLKWTPERPYKITFQFCENSQN